MTEKSNLRVGLAGIGFCLLVQIEALVFEMNPGVPWRICNSIASLSVLSRCIIVSVTELQKDVSRGARMMAYTTSPEKKLLSSTGAARAGMAMMAAAATIVNFMVDGFVAGGSSRSFRKAELFDGRRDKKGGKATSIYTFVMNSQHMVLLGYSRSAAEPLSSYSD